MSADRKAKLARLLGYICVVAGGLNLTLAAVNGPGLPAAGISALTLGIIMIALGKQKPTSGA